MKKLFSVLCLSWLSLSCGSGTQLEFEGDPRPIVQGIYFTLESSPEPVGRWGNPHLESERDFTISLPTPNPATGYTEFAARLPDHAHVRIWATPAILPSEVGYTTQGGAIVQAPIPGWQILIRDDMLQAGMHETRWEFDPATTPPGPYRVYMSANGRLSWTDVWVYHTDSDLPAFLSFPFN